MSMAGIEIEIVLLLVAVPIWLLLLRDTWRAWQPARLMLAGRHAEARAAAEGLQRSWMRVFPTVRQTTVYTIASALHLEGDLEGSLAALAPLSQEQKRLGANLRYAILSIQAANLVLLDREHARAGELLEETARIQQPPEDRLLAAHAKLGLGDRDAATALFAAAGKERPAKGWRLGSVTLIEDQRQQEAIFHMLRGSFLVKIGQHAEAQRDLDLAARLPASSIYARRAREMLRARPSTEVEGPSSLDPQVVAKWQDD